MCPLKLEYIRHHQIPPAVRGTGTTPVAAKGVDQIHITTTPSSMVKSWQGLIRFLPLLQKPTATTSFGMFQLGTSDMRKIAGLSGFIPVLQKVEEILWQKSIHCINVFGKKAEETPSRNGIKELQRCGHDPLQQSVVDIL